MISMSNSQHMDAYKEEMASQVGSSAKENLPPKTNKRTVSLSKLFDQTRGQGHKSRGSNRDTLAPRPAGISKANIPKQGFFAKYGKPKKKPEHPIYTSFAGKLTGSIFST